MKMVPGNFDTAEMLLSKADHHSAKPAIPHEQIGPSPQHKVWHAALTAIFDARTRILIVGGFEVNIRRAADAESCSPGKRLAPTDNRSGGKAPGQFSRRGSRVPNSAFRGRDDCTHDRTSASFAGCARSLDSAAGPLDRLVSAARMCPAI